MKALHIALFAALVIVSHPADSLAGTVKSALSSRLSKLINTEELASDDIDDGAFENGDKHLKKAVSAVKAFILDIEEFQTQISASVRKDLLSLLKSSLKELHAARLSLAFGDIDGALESIDFALLSLKFALSRIKTPKVVDCNVSALYVVHPDPVQPNQNYPRDEIYVRCNRSFDDLTVAVVPGSGAGEIGSASRDYALVGTPHPFTGGSTSCINNLSSATCLQYQAKPGGTAAIALGIYDNPGPGLSVEVTVIKSGKTIFSDTVVIAAG